MSAPHPSSGHGNSSWPQTVAYSTATWGGGMGVAPQLIEGGRAQTLNCSICFCPKWTLRHHLARWWANLPWERGREHHGRPRWGRRATDHPPMVEDVGRTSSADRSPLRPFGSQATGQTLPPRSARQGRTQERLANGRGHRRARSAGGATPAELGQVGRGRGPRRPEGVRGGASWRRGDGRTHRRRDRLPEEGHKERGGGPPVHGHRGEHGQ